jgi:FkbM family methyltransferase
VGRDGAAARPRGGAPNDGGAIVTAMQTGVGHHYRERSWFERWSRIAQAVRMPSWLRAALRRAMEIVLRILPGDHLTCRLPGGERIRVDPAYRHLAWNPQEYAALKTCTRRGATVFDVGANVGAYTLLFAQWVGAAGRVYAFEPAAASRAGLVRHLTINGLTPRVLVRNEAVAARGGHRGFVAVGTHGDNRLASAAGESTIDVPVVSLDEFCDASDAQPDVIKIDVEGAELEVLRGARRTIARRASTLALFVELHPALWPAFGYSRADIEAELMRQRLTIEPLPGVGDPWATEGICVRLRSVA